MCEMVSIGQRVSGRADGFLNLVDRQITFARLPLEMVALIGGVMALESELVLRAALARRPERGRDESAEPAGERRPPRLAGPGPDERL
jgi:hypothetical protein